MPKQVSHIKAKLYHNPPPRKEAFNLKKETILHKINTGQFNPVFPQPGQETKEAGRPDFDLTHPDDWPKWLKNCHTENAGVHVTKEGKVIWCFGSFHDGIWMDGLFMGGRWRDGIWLGGDFYEGIWCAGEFRGGVFHSWIWKDGVFRGGVFRGLWMGGIWEHGKFQGYWRRTATPPGLRIENEEWEMI